MMTNNVLDTFRCQKIHQDLNYSACISNMRIAKAKNQGGFCAECLEGERYETHFRALYKARKEIELKTSDTGREINKMPKGIKECPACKKLIGGSSKLCECGHVFKKKGPDEGPSELKNKIKEIFIKAQGKRHHKDHIGDRSTNGHISLDRLLELKLKYEAKAVVIREIIAELEGVDQ